MGLLRHYILSILCAAMICGIILAQVKKGFAAGLIRLLCGVFLILTLLRPLHQLHIPELPDVLDRYAAQAREISEQGRRMADTAASQRISQQLEAYILDKAAQLQMNITVDITLDEDWFPASVIIRGEVTESAQKKLSQWLETELGITKEAQQWREDSSPGQGSG